MGGQSNVYAYKVNDLFVITSFVYEGRLGGQKVQNSVYKVIKDPHRRKYNANSHYY